MVVPQRPPRRARYLVPLGLPRRAEILAALAIVALVASALLIPLALLLAVAFHAVSRLSRWRPQWLAIPACSGAVWLLAIGPGAAFRATGSALSHAASLVTSPARIPAAQAHDLAGQFPLALILAAAAATVTWWLRWLHTDEWDLPATRPGLASRWRRWVTVGSVRRGGVVTRTGVCLGADRLTGRPAALSWREAAAGVLVTGASPGAVRASSLQFAHAAIRRRKPVIVVDLAGGRDLPGTLAAICAAAAAPLGVLGAEGAFRYQPARDGLAACGLTDPDLAVLRESPLGRLFAPGQGAGTRISVADVVRRRAVLLFVLDRRRYGRAAEVLANLVAADIDAVYSDLARLGIPAEGLVWFTECTGTDPALLARLAAPGSQPGLAPVLATTAPGAASALAGHVNAGVFHRLTDRTLAAELAALTGTRLVPVSHVLAADPAQPATETPWTATGHPVPFGTTPAPVLPPQALCELADDEFVLVSGLARAWPSGMDLPVPDRVNAAGGAVLAGGEAGLDGAVALPGGTGPDGVAALPARAALDVVANGNGAVRRSGRGASGPAVTVLARCQAVSGRLPAPLVPAAPARRGPSARRPT